MLFLFRIGSRLFLILISFVMVMFFLACSNKSENELVLLSSLEESLSNSNKTINRSAQSLLELLKEKVPVRIIYTDREGREQIITNYLGKTVAG